MRPWFATLFIMAACGQGPRSEAQTSASHDGSAGSGPATSGFGTGSVTAADGDGDSGEPPRFDVLPPDGGPNNPAIPPIPKTCAQAEAAPTTVGCEFYSVKLLASSAQGPYGLVVANVQDDQPARVELEVRDATGWRAYEGSPVDIAPLDLHIFTETQVGEWVFRVRSDVPVTAYQFRPLDGSNTYESSDASMLYPVPAWDAHNMGLTWPHGPSAGDQITVVAAQDQTQLDVTTPAESRARIMTGSVSSPAITFPAGQSTPVTLDDGEQLIVFGPHDLASGLGTDISGTRVDSSAPVAMFVAHPCSYIPANVPACDHLEEQMAGLSMWGRAHVAARLPVRENQAAGSPEPETELWHVLASEDGTMVTFEAEPAVTGLPVGGVTLDAGDKLELRVGGSFAEPGDFLVLADKPIQVFTYMAGVCDLPSVPQCVDSVHTEELGDPAMVQMSPVEQHLTKYVVLVPPTWDNDFLVLTRVAGSPIRIDGQVVPDDRFVPVPGGHEVGRVRVDDGVRRLDGDDPFGVVVVGYDDFDSYAYLGGQNALVINEPAG